MNWYLLHPMAVHFPIVLLTLGFAVCVLDALRGRPAWLAEAASWLLWLGAASVWAAVGLGLLAERTAEHVPTAWEVLGHHEELAYWTGRLFSGLAIFRFWMHRRDYAVSRWVKAGFLAGWLLACGVLAYTAHHGGELVFDYGMGVSVEGE